MYVSFYFLMYSTLISPVDVTVVFWASEVMVGERGAFQIALSAPGNVTMVSLPIEAVEVVFGGGGRPVVVAVKHEGGDGEVAAVQRVELGHVDVRGSDGGGDGGSGSGCLRWRPGDTVVLCGTVSSDVPCSIKVTFYNFLVECFCMLELMFVRRCQSWY